MSPSLFKDTHFGAWFLFPLPNCNAPLINRHIRLEYN